MWTSVCEVYGKKKKFQSFCDKNSYTDERRACPKAIKSKYWYWIYSNDTCFVNDLILQEKEKDVGMKKTVLVSLFGVKYWLKKWQFFKKIFQ